MQQPVKCFEDICVNFLNQLILELLPAHAANLVLHGNPRAYILYFFSCIYSSNSKVKCDRELPCSRCLSRQKECVYPPATRKASRFTAQTLDSQSSVASYSSVVSVTPAESSDQHSISSHDHTSATESSSQIPVGSHLASLYNHDMFEPFFSDVFSTEDRLLHPSPSASAIHLSGEIQSPDRGLAPCYNPVQNDTSTHYGSFFLRDVTSFVPHLQPAASNRQAFVNQEDAERRHYCKKFSTSLWSFILDQYEQYISSTMLL